MSQDSIGVVTTDDESYRNGRQLRSKTSRANREALLQWSGLDLETKIFSPSGRGRTFFLTSLFIELIDSQDGAECWIDQSATAVESRLGFISSKRAWYSRRKPLVWQPSRNQLRSTPCECRQGWNQYSIRQPPESRTEQLWAEGFLACQQYIDR